MEWQVFKKIREYYKDHAGWIIKYYPLLGPVYQDLIQICGFEFSPIENMVWQDIKLTGVSLLCPQFPVEKYFIDFADPAEMVGLEADSVAWHTDAGKDLERQRDLESMGWTIYRLDSATAYKEQATIAALRQIEKTHYGKEWLEKIKCKRTGQSKVMSLGEVLSQLLSSPPWKTLSNDLKMIS